MVIAGCAEVVVVDEACRVRPGGLVLIPKCLPHEVRNCGEDVLRFAAIYAEPDVVTTYEHPVQPDGSCARHTVS